MTLAAVLAEDRRLLLLQALREASDYQLNEAVLKQALIGLGHRVGGDVVRADLQWLADHGLVTLTKLPAAGGDLWLARLTAAGDDVAQGRLHPGVSRPAPV